MGVIFVVAARAKVSSLRVGLPWTYGLQSKLPSTTGRSALISLTAFHDLYRGTVMRQRVALVMPPF